MNINKTSFNAELPTILKHIANSHFVALDLELSGIHNQRRRDAEGKQNLQQRYNELKSAAQKFHILQVGITCVEQDLETRTYVIRPYNFNISPLISREIDIERDFTYSTGAVDFLLEHGYQMEAPFSLGVPYLTRSEAELARERARLRWDRASIPDIKIDASDEQTLSFMQRVRDEINAWQVSPKHAETPCIIRGPPAPTSEDQDARLYLNRFERRIVHQLVRAEFPKLSTSTKGDYMHINLKNNQQHNGPSTFMQRRFADALFLQMGFRWIVEALIGGDLSGINPDLCGPRIACEPDAPNPKQFARRLEQLSDAVRSRRRVLVGHNCFLDLVFFYQNFVTDLPDTVQGFQDAIGDLFPLIIDTKFTATNVPGGGPYRSSQLSQIDQALSNLEYPKLEIPNGHPPYDSTESYHEAGFDSYATAKVFLRLTAQLEAGERHEDEQNAASREPPLVQPAAEGNTANKSNSRLDGAADASLSTLMDDERNDKTKSKPKQKLKAAAKKIGGSKLSSKNTFDSLRDLSDDDGVPLPSDNDADSRNAADSGTLNTSLAKRKDAASPLSSASKVEQSNQLIPPWTAYFWREYGNKLRVYGTVEEALDLSVKIDSANEAIDETAWSSDQASGSARRHSLLAAAVDKFKSFLI